MAIPANPPSSATPAIVAVWRAVYDRWGSVVGSAGVYVCRNIAGTSTPSQHSWGNAWDITGSTATLDHVAAFLGSASMRSHVAQVLWRVPDHYTHIHVSGRPMRAGIPPCMEGGGVPSYETPTELAYFPPTVGELVVFESWAPAARSASRELIRRASRIARVPEVLARIIGRG